MDYNIKLKCEIKNKGITQRVLAEKIGEPESVVSLLINNRYMFPKKRLEYLQRKIAKVLRVARAAIFDV